MLLAVALARSWSLYNTFGDPKNPPKVLQVIENICCYQGKVLVCLEANGCFRLRETPGREVLSRSLGDSASSTGFV
jgi:hypothetical protein